MATRILYVITKANWGGAQRYVYDLATAAKDRGFEVSVAYGEDGELGKRLASAGIRTIVVPAMQNRASLAAIWKAYRALRAVFKKERPDIIHINSSLAGAAGALAAHVVPTATVLFTAHAWAFNENRPWLQKSALAFFAWLAVVCSSKTIVVSKAMERQMYGAPFTHGKMVVISNGTRTYDFLEKHAARAALSDQYPALAGFDGAHDVWIGTVAELHPVKGLSYAIDAVRELSKKYPNVRYLILGGGQLRATLEAQIAKLELQQHVFLLGHVSDAPHYEKAFDIFVLPSFSEAFGISILEAGLAGVPVVATNVGGIPEIITSTEEGLLVPPKDSQALATAIDSLLTDTQRRGEIGAALQRRILSEFMLERVVQRTLALY